MNPEEYIVKSSSGDYSRKVWLLRSKVDEPQKLCVFLDAEYYLHRMETPSIVSNLQTRCIIPSVTCLFVSHVNGEARHADYTCNDNYSRFISYDLFRWVKENSAGISEQGNLICGLSLSGLASAYLALTHPGPFALALCQSGSFWWNNEWLTGQVKTLSPTKGKFWVSVGDNEVNTGILHPPTGIFQGVSQYAATERAVQELKAFGATVNYHVFSGGHEIALWQQELPSALSWLIDKNSDRIV